MDTRTVELASQQTTFLSEWRSELWRMVLAAIAVLILYSWIGWPSGPPEVLFGLGATLIGYGFATLGAFLWHLHLAPGQLAARERDELLHENELLCKRIQTLVAEDALHLRRYEIVSEQLERSESARKTAEATGSVWAGVAREQKQGHDVPFEAIMARLKSEVGVVQSTFLGPAKD